MSSADPTVFIIEDDAGVRDSLALLLGLKGHRTQSFANAEDFLAVYRSEWPGCLVLDIRMPGMSGLELQAALAQRGMHPPVIAITAHGDIATARTALKAGAVDFLEKPVDTAALTTAIETALDADARGRRASDESAQIALRLQRLSKREREVMEMVVAGQPIREIAVALDLSPRTVEVYKSRMMEKLQVQKLSDLIRLVLRSDASTRRP